MSDKKRIINSIIICIIITLLIVSGIFKCPIKYIFGLSCPFCGITRAFYSVLLFDFNKAFFYHALWPIVFIFIILHVLIEFKIIKINKKLSYISLYVLAIINLIYYFYRLINHIGIVKIEFTKSLIYKIISIFM